jgi:hypothetical protein
MATLVFGVSTKLWGFVSFMGFHSGMDIIQGTMVCQKSLTNAQGRK